MRTLEWNFPRLMRRKKIKPEELVTLLKRAGVPRSLATVYRWLKTAPVKIDRRVEDALCEILDCVLADLWIPPPEKPAEPQGKRKERSMPPRVRLLDGKL